MPLPPPPPVLEIQLQGTITSLEAFELRLRAAGADEGVRFRAVETVCKLPPLPGGGVTGKVRLVKSSSKDESWRMIQEHDVTRDARDLAKLVEVDQCELRGEVEVTVKQLGFIPEFQIGRVGKRVAVGVVEGDGALQSLWDVEYYLLFDPKTRPNGTKQHCFVLDTAVGGDCWLVTLRKRFEDGKQAASLFAQSTKLLKRLQPELQPVTWSAIDAEVAANSRQHM